MFAKEKAKQGKDNLGRNWELILCAALAFTLVEAMALFHVVFKGLSFFDIFFL